VARYLGNELVGITKKFLTDAIKLVLITESGDPNPKSRHVKNH
jgi:hypothetical protein